MAIQKKRKELQRLLESFEAEAAKYHALDLSVIYITDGWVSDGSKLIESNHAIPLWQYYGKLASDEEINKLLENVKNYNPIFGVPGAKFYAFGLLEGKNIDLFLRMAKRAGNVFSEKEVEKMKKMTLDDLAGQDTSLGKPVFVTNSNPIAVWLNFMLYHSSISHPKQFTKTVVNVDPFAESVKAIDHLLENGTIDRGESPFSSIDSMKFKVALSFPGEKRKYVQQIARNLTEKMGSNTVFYDIDYQAHLARPNLDLLLQKIYRDNSDLIVVFLCKEYEEKEWCGLEWRAIREIIKARTDSGIMFFRFDDADVKGIFSIDGYIDLRKVSPDQATQYILERVQMLHSYVATTPLSPPEHAESISLKGVRNIPKPPRLKKEIINDTKVVKKIFHEITTLRELDYFIDQALYPFLINSVLEQHEYFERYLQSSYYHVFDDRLRELINSFYTAWSGVCQHEQAFTPTNVPDKLRPYTLMDVATTEDVEAAIKMVPAAAKIMHQSLQELLRYIRNTFKDLYL